MLSEKSQRHWYMVDITELFLTHCSLRAFNVAASYMGSIVELTELCCYIALLRIQGSDIDVSEIITKHVAPNILSNVRDHTLLVKVVNAFSDILQNNFVYMSVPKPLHLNITHIQITDVKTQFPDTNFGDVMPGASLAILAQFYWNDLTRSNYESRVQHTYTHRYRT